MYVNAMMRFWYVHHPQRRDYYPTYKLHYQRTNHGLRCLIQFLSCLVLASRLCVNLFSPPTTYFVYGDCSLLVVWLRGHPANRQHNPLPPQLAL
jgi:hypothetical protein